MYIKLTSIYKLATTQATRLIVESLEAFLDVFVVVTRRARSRVALDVDIERYYIVNPVGGQVDEVPRLEDDLVCVHLWCV